MIATKATEGIVKIRHYRNREGFVSEPEWYTRGRGFVVETRDSPITFDRATPTSRGGITRAGVRLGDRFFYAWANCSLSDAFCYALGSTIARGRLRKQLEEAGLGGTVQL